MEPSPATPPAGPVGAPSPAPPSCPSTAAAAPGSASAAVAPPASGPPGRRPTVPVCPSVPPGMRLPYDPNGREWRKPFRPAGAAAAASAGAESAACLAPEAGPGPSASSSGFPAVVPEERLPLFGHSAPALPRRPAPSAVRAWLAPLGTAVASADWLLVSDVFLQAHPHDAGEAAAVWRAFKEFAKVAGYGTRPAAERDFASFVRSVGDSAAWLRCMLRCNPERVVLVPHPAAKLPFVAGEEEIAYLEDWHARLRHRPAVPFCHYLALANFGGVGPLIALASVGPATAPADLALEAARRARGELVSARRAGHGAILLSVRSGIALTLARAPLPPAMVRRCATPRVLTYEYPPVVHQQQLLLQAIPCHPI